MSDFVKELNFDGDTFNDMKRDMSNLAIQNGYKPEQIETSDVSMMSSVMGYFKDASHITLHLVRYEGPTHHVSAR